MAEPYAESPLAAREELLARSTVPDRVHIAEVPFKEQVDVRVDRDGPAAERMGKALGGVLPGRTGEIVVSGGVSILGLGPDEWLLIGPEEDAESIQSTVATALAEDHGAVVDVSAHRTILSISGPEARDLLNKGCALDLHPSRFASDTCAQTLLARAGVILVCRDAAKAHFWLIVRSSFARYVADWLADAAAEYREDGQTS